jgi:ubiquinone/menaquinone biosynthesis C-methylase UbiE
MADTRKKPRTIVETLPFLEKFTGRAAAYSAGRPSYPREMIDILRKETGFDHTRIVADIGSGTGILSKLFLENGNQVYGVEPNKEMRNIAEKTLADYSLFVSVNGTAENSTIVDASIDLVTVGQALHWFDSELASTEFARILKPTGYLCVLYNDRNKDSEFMGEYDQVIQKYARDRAKVLDINHEYLSKFYCEGSYSKFLLPNNQILDLGGLFSRMTSASYMPHPSEAPAYSALKRDVEKLFISHEEKGRVRLAYDTSVFLGQTRR